MRLWHVLGLILLCIHDQYGLLHTVFPARGLGGLRNGRFMTLNRAPSALSAAAKANALDDSQYSQYFAQWEEEEKELYSAEQKERAEKDRLEDEADGYAPYMPEYMRKILDSLEDGSPPRPASKLPAIVVMGRPNTGKSTIVNRITESFKVPPPVTL